MSARVTMERRLFLAIQEENEETVRRILAENPNVNVNWENEGRFYHGWTALHKAIAEGYDRIVSLLLAHSEINVNQRDSDDVHGQTPFHWACFSGMTSCARLLLEDARVGNLNEPNNEGYTPLWNAASGGYLDVIKWWIASGRDMDLGQPGNERTDAIQVANENGRTEVATLLERFRENPAQTRYDVFVELGLLDRWIQTDLGEYERLEQAGQIVRWDPSETLRPLAGPRGTPNRVVTFVTIEGGGFFLIARLDPVTNQLFPPEV